MDREVCDRIVAKYKELEKANITNELVIQVALTTGILILFFVIIWALEVKEYIKYIGSVVIGIGIIMVIYNFGKFVL